MDLNILIVSPCSGSKRYEAVADCGMVDETSRKVLVEEFPTAVALAAEMYTGQEHGHIHSAVQQLGQVANVEWYLLSAGFGVISSETEIPSYECTFSNTEQVQQRAERIGVDVTEMTNNELLVAVSREMNIPQDLQHILTKGYDLAFIALGTQYLIASHEALTTIPDETTAFAYAAKGSKEFIGDCHWIPATEEERSHFGTTWLELRGRELLSLAERIEESQDLEQIRTNPEEGRRLSTI